MVVEDGIPLSYMIKNTMALGGDIYATFTASPRSCICTEITEEEYNSREGGSAGSWCTSVTDANENTTYYLGACIASTLDDTELTEGTIAGALMSR